MRIPLFCAVAAFAILAGGAARAAPVADYVADFSAVANPNGGWSYGTTATLGGALTLFPSAQDYSGGGDARYDWNVGGRTPLVGLLIPAASPGVGILHPGSGGIFAEALYTAQSTFVGALTVGFAVGDTATTTDVHVLRNGASLFDAFVDGANPSQAFSAVLSLQAGDALAFLVGWGANGTIAFDTTYFTAVLAEADVPEPAAMAVLAVGALGLSAARRRRNRRI